MSNIETYTFTAEDITGVLNDAKEVFVNTLKRENVITEDQANNILANYSIVVAKPSWLGRTITKWFCTKSNKDKLSYIIVKVLPSGVPNEPSNCSDDKSETKESVE